MLKNIRRKYQDRVFFKALGSMLDNCKNISDDKHLFVDGL